MYIIITKNKDFANMAREMECEVFQDNNFIMFNDIEGNVNTEIFLTSLLGWLAIDPDIKGYDYIKYVLRKCIEEKDYYKREATKEIYPELARYFNTTATRADRAMRHAIEISFAEVPERYVRIFNRVIKEQPNNTKFIAMIAVIIQNILENKN